jgi:hypothetical protein
LNKSRVQAIDIFKDLMAANFEVAKMMGQNIGRYAQRPDQTRQPVVAGKGVRIHIGYQPAMISLPDPKSE